MKFRQKKKKGDVTEPALIIGFAVCLIVFGLFSALMVASLKWSSETTILQMTFQLPAWELIAVIAFIGLVISLALIMFFEHRILYKNQEKQIKFIEKKLDRLIYEQRKRSIILKNVDTETKKASEVEDVKERLPFESIDDFIDTFIEMSDSEIEDMTVQLLDEDAVLRTESDPDQSGEEQKPQKVIPFKRRKTK